MRVHYWNKLKNILIYISLSACFTLFFNFVFLAHLSATTNSHGSIDSTPLTLDSDFPIYPTIKPNVEFWIDIFTKYSKSQGVIHDNRNLEIVYEIITLDGSNTLRARRKNKKKIKAVIQKYKNILLNLSKGNKSLSNQFPSNPETKKVAALFGVTAKPEDFKNAAYNIRCQTGLNRQFKRGLQRSGAVIDEFRRIFLSHGLPVDLIYLPCVESSFNFKAYSKFGAAGVWQFTRSTGRRYMKIGYVVDERRDPYISTDAAARLLKKNYAVLGEWPLAITAYNHGLAGMQRAKAKKGTYENIVESHSSRSFKFASRNFYSEFLAAKIVAKNPEKYFDTIQYNQPVSFQLIKTKGFLSIKNLTDILNCTIQDIKTLNPALRKPVFDGQKYIPKGYNLKLPENLPVQNLNNKLTALYKSRQKPSRFHRVQKGDTAGSIARIHSVTLKDLTLANRLNRRATIYIGQNLRIPVMRDLYVNNEITLTKAKQKSIKKDFKPEKNMDKKPENTIDSAAELTVESPAIPVKDKIVINPNIVTANLKIFNTFLKGNVLIGVIKVETEETLGHYAEWLQIPTQKIRILNKFAYGQPITVDQKIKIPLTATTAQKFEEQRYEFHKEMEEDFFESFVIQSTDTYEVKNGDNIWNLCLNKLEIPFWLLKKYNPKTDFASLQAGRNIKYPIVAALRTD